MEDGALIDKIFFPYAMQKQEEVFRKKTRFVHYTSAEVAINILRKKEVWMRNASVMNDFLEIDHGLDCLNNAWHSSSGDRMKKVLDELVEGLSQNVASKFDAWVPHFRRDTYLTSISEHLESEDEIGRLSMWRAYGGTTGVALVLNNTAFVNPSDALKAYTSPVAYLDRTSFLKYFDEVVSGLEKYKNYIKSLPQETILAYLFNAFQFAVLCTKHPGFVEEREWRVIHSPTFQPSQRITSEVQIVRGTPQRIFKIPLANVPEDKFFGATIPELINRIIIGPTEYPNVIKDAFKEELEKCGVTNAEKRIFVSDIPLRQ